MKIELFGERNKKIILILNLDKLLLIFLNESDNEVSKKMTLQLLIGF